MQRLSVQANMPSQPCPFCGLVTEVPHETQEGCIAALRLEISRMRGILSSLRPTAALRVFPEDEQDNPTRIRLVLK
jgi:hypothetical protein